MWAFPAGAAVLNNIIVHSSYIKTTTHHQTEKTQHDRQLQNRSVVHWTSRLKVSSLPPSLPACPPHAFPDSRVSAPRALVTLRERKRRRKEIKGPPMLRFGGLQERFPQIKRSMSSGRGGQMPPRRRWHSCHTKAFRPQLLHRLGPGEGRTK